ncbi:MAG: preprotein translocase subunit YajC [Campylobacterota bacterium]
MNGDLIGSLLPLIVLFAIFYFLIIRPQQQTAKKHKQMIENMKKGDKIVTSGGLIAEVVKVEDEFFRIKLADNTEVKIIKEYVARLVDEESK